MTADTSLAPLRIVWRKVGVAFTLLVGAYLFVGLMLAVDRQPQQMWQCRDPGSSTGIMNYGTPHAGCEPTVSLGERLGGGAVYAVLWGPLVVANGFAGGG